MWGNHISESVAEPHVMGNTVIHCVVDPKVKEMKAKYGFESYDCLTVDRKQGF